MQEATMKIINITKQEESLSPEEAKKRKEEGTL